MRDQQAKLIARPTQSYVSGDRAIYGVTHTQMDVDALVSAWLIDRFLFPTRYTGWYWTFAPFNRPPPGLYEGATAICDIGGANRTERAGLRTEGPCHTVRGAHADGSPSSSPVTLLRPPSVLSPQSS